MAATKTAVKKPAEVDIDALWKEFYKIRSEQARNSLMEHYLPIVKYTAERIYVKLPDKVEVDDLISAGIFGLMDAIDAFDPQRGVKFATYCTPRIRGAILDELRSMDWVPRLVRARAHQLNNAMRTLEAHLGRLPSDNEIADELDMDMGEFHRLQRDATAVGIVSLSNNLDVEGDNDICEIDIVEDKKSEDPMVEAQKRDLKSLLTKGLTRAERLILILYYYEEMTMKEIGATLDLSESRVSQMHSSIVARLKAQMDSRKKEFSINK
jgi:RNA polymerase sigma factor for flagellar operon FliA